MTVYDDDGVKDDRKIGEATIDLWDVVTEPEFLEGDARWLTLRKGKLPDAAPGAKDEKGGKDGKSSPKKGSPKRGDEDDDKRKQRGQLYVQLQWHKKIVKKSLPMSKDPLEIEPNDVSTGILEIKVVGCRRLMATSGNKDDPFVSIGAIDFTSILSDVPHILG